MQEAVGAVRAPVAAIERVAADQIEGAGHRLAVLLGHHQQHAIGHAFAQREEEFAGQIGAAPFALAGVDVEAEEVLPVGAGDRWAGQPLDGEPVAQRRLAFLADHLALA